MYTNRAELIARRLGMIRLSDEEVAELVEIAVKEQDEAWGKFCAGVDKALNTLTGAVMKLSKGNADGKVISQILLDKRETEV